MKEGNRITSFHLFCFLLDKKRFRHCILFSVRFKVRIDYHKSLFLLSPSSETPKTRNDHPCFSSLAASLLDALTRVHSLPKSEEKERLLAVKSKDSAI